MSKGVVGRSAVLRDAEASGRGLEGGSPGSRIRPL